MLGIALAVTKPPLVTPANVTEVLAAIRKPGAQAVLLNVWATWCEPCKEEMPELIRFYKEHKDQGLRLVLVSSDDPKERHEVAKFLAAEGVDFPTFVKVGDDMRFIDTLEPNWSGALPASFLYDGEGKKRRFWPGKVTYEQLANETKQLLKRRKQP